MNICSPRAPIAPKLLAELLLVLSVGRASSTTYAISTWQGGNQAYEYHNEVLTSSPPAFQSRQMVVSALEFKTPVLSFAHMDV